MRVGGRGGSSQGGELARRGARKAQQQMVSSGQQVANGLGSSSRPSLASLLLSVRTGLVLRSSNYFATTTDFLQSLIN